MIKTSDWPTNAREAVAIQQELRHKVVLKDDCTNIQTIAGIDVGYDKARDLSRAVIVLMDYETLALRQSLVIYAPTPFPYVPGLLSFREAPVILSGLDLLEKTPDLLMIDGQGIAHPRRLGIAAHIGVLTDLPAIGVAKSCLTGTYDEPGREKGETAPLYDGDEVIGTVLRSRTDVKPLFVAPGHKVGFETAVKITQNCLTRFRLPEPTRQADKLTKVRST